MYNAREKKSVPHLIGHFFGLFLFFGRDLLLFDKSSARAKKNTTPLN